GGLAVAGQEDVRGLQVAVDDALGVRVVDGAGQRFEPAGGLVRRQRPAYQLFRQAAALDEFQREVRARQALADLVVADLEELDDVGVLQARHRPGLGAEALPLVRVGEAAAQQHLQGDHAAQPDVRALVGAPHAAPAALRPDLITAHPPGGRIALRQQGGRRRLAVARQGGVRQALQRARGLLAPGTPFQVFAQLLQVRFRQVAQLEGGQLRRGQALATGHGETLGGPTGNRVAAFRPRDGGARSAYYPYCAPVTAGGDHEQGARPSQPS